MRQANSITVRHELRSLKTKSQAHAFRGNEPTTDSRADTASSLQNLGVQLQNVDREQVRPVKEVLQTSCCAHAQVPRQRKHAHRKYGTSFDSFPPDSKIKKKGTTAQYNECKKIPQIREKSIETEGHMSQWNFQESTIVHHLRALECKCIFFSLRKVFPHSIACTKL
jgi:hypothetical protein